ncbi:sigma-70 family RNA polymerase sigma factor [Flavisolibacter nicotianae]|uniref:sigma-70 family RNA polymerase sigma factor n=1 Tax=Flavisolibacter nicotianae TaxID=2364882 RepID=UPI000EB2021A|nr:sigma-70 family RNA polymerase sigma factor [Flavisolibacter nicotianae]
MATSTLTASLWKEHSEKLKQFICHKVNDDDCCNDILHDLFFKIRDKEEKIALLEKPASYIIKMAQNAVIDYYRSQKEEPTEICEYGPLAGSQEFSSTELYNITLLPYIENLPAIYRDALILSDLEGLPQKELAEKLNISYTGAKSRVQRARQMLKEAILKCCNYKFDKFGNVIGCCE